MREVDHRLLPLMEAAEILGTEDLGEAQRLARIELRAAALCPVCRLLLRHVSPVTPESRTRDLLERFARWERDDHSMRLVAAWIVLRGTGGT